MDPSRAPKAAAAPKVVVRPAAIYKRGRRSQGSVLCAVERKNEEEREVWRV
jgi:hypothetical protein